MKLEKLNLPEEIKTEVLSTLMAYDTCYIYQDCVTLKYSVSTALTLTAHSNDVIVETIQVTDVYTKEERQLNYANTFFDYPMSYKGVRDYPKMGEMREWYTKNEVARPFKLEFDSNENMVFVNSN